MAGAGSGVCEGVGGNGVGEVAELVGRGGGVAVGSTFGVVAGAGSGVEVVGGASEAVVADGGVSGLVVGGGVSEVVVAVGAASAGAEPVGVTAVPHPVRARPPGRAAATQAVRDRVRFILTPSVSKYWYLSLPGLRRPVPVVKYQYLCTVGDMDAKARRALEAAVAAEQRVVEARARVPVAVDARARALILAHAAGYPWEAIADAIEEAMPGRRVTPQQLTAAARTRVDRVERRRKAEPRKPGRPRNQAGTANT